MTIPRPPAYASRVSGPPDPLRSRASKDDETRDRSASASSSGGGWARGLGDAVVARATSGPWKRLGSLSFLRFLARRLSDDRLLPVAAELTFITLLSLTPLSALALSVMKVFPMFEGAVGSVQDFVFSNFIPTEAQVVREHVLEFAERASKLTLPGIGVLIFTVLLGMWTIEEEINTIWRVPHRRGALSRLLVFWAVITVGPILVGTGLLVTSYLASLPLLTTGEEPSLLGTALLSALPPLTSFLAFTLLYVVVPNRRVPLSTALFSALLSAAFFELAKRLFGVYIGQLSIYNSLYGAFAALPALLVWIYLSWAITLFGAELAACLTCYHPDADDQENGASTLHYAVRFLAELRSRQLAGETSMLTYESMGRIGSGTLPWSAQEDVLKRLEQAKLVHLTADDTLALTRPLHEVPLRDLHLALGGPLPDPERLPEDDPLRGVVARANTLLDDALSVSVEDVVRPTPPTERA